MKYYIIAGAMLAATSPATAHDTLHGAASSNGKFGFTYDYSNMKMDGNRDGKDKISEAEIIMKGYMMAPKEMDHETHNFGAYYGLTPNHTFSVSVPYVKKDMTMVDMMGAESGMKSSGIGDVRVMGTYALVNHSHSPGSSRSMNFYYGVSIPTGAVDKEDDGAKLPYMMQLGSGTFDPIVGLAIANNYGELLLGADVSAIFRFGENDEGYRFGNHYSANVYTGYQYDSVALTVGVRGSKNEDIKGADNDLMPMMDPTQDGNLYAGEQIDLVAGLGYSHSSGAALSGEFSKPVYQKLDGPQLMEDYRFMVKLGKSFNE